MIIVKTENTEMFLKKKLLRRTFFFLGMFIFLIFNETSAQNNQDTVLNSKIVESIINADVDGLSNFFYTQIDLVFPDEFGIYSKRQAKFILKDFFKDNVPESFNIINQNNNKGSNFIVGKLHTASQHYRVCFLTKENKNETLIYQIRIEK